MSPKTLNPTATSPIPLRTKDERVLFCDTFFQSVEAPITYQSDDYREYKLPRDIDKELTDRPYYWLWVEQTGQDVEPTTLRLAFTSEALERENKRLYDEAWASVDINAMSEVERMFFRPPTAELVSLGGFRLEKIMNSVLRRGRLVYARPRHCAGRAKLVPWLLMNAVVSYECDFTKQEFVSLGLCLFNHQIVDNFFQAVSRIPMEAVAPETLLDQSVDRYTGDLIEDSIKDLQSYLTQKLKLQPHQWATEARSRLNDDLEQLDIYYASLLVDDAQADKPVIEADHQRKRRELIQRAEPKIDVQVSQLAIIGLAEKN